MCRMCRMDILTMTNLSFFFFNDTATTEIYTLSLHDALPIWDAPRLLQRRVTRPRAVGRVPDPHGLRGGRSRGAARGAARGREERLPRDARASDVSHRVHGAHSGGAQQPRGAGGRGDRAGAQPAG